MQKNKTDLLKHFPKIELSQVKAELCRRSFYYFLKEFWETIIHETPVYNWHIEYLCNELQEIAMRVKRREPFEYEYYIINVPPASSKSTIVSQMYIAWCWTIDPTQRFGCGSYSQTIARKDAAFTLQIINSDKYREYFPSIKLNKDAVDLFKNNSGGERYATSVGSGITGVHFHQIVIDDLMNPQQSNSKAERSTANEWVLQTLPTRKVDKQITPTIIVMQRLHEEDICGVLLGKKNISIKHICLPAEVDMNIKPLSLASNYKDGLLDPVRLSRPILNSMKETLGSYGYAGQMQQKPAPTEGGIFKKAWFPVIEFSSMPQGTNYFNADTAYTSDEKNDPTGMMAYRIAQNNLYIINFKKGHWEFPEQCKNLVEFVKENGYSLSSIIEAEPKACFEKGTKIKTLAGYKNIEDFIGGELIPTINEVNRSIEINTVDKLLCHNEARNSIKMITFVINNIKIKCTDGHLFYINGNWMPAYRIAKRKMEIHPKSRTEVRSIKSGTNIIFHGAIPEDNETIRFLSGLSKNSNSYKWKTNNNKSSSRGCDSIYTKSNELPTSEPYRQYKKQQFSREFRMGNTQNEYAARKQKRTSKANLFQRYEAIKSNEGRKNVEFKADGETSIRNTRKIQKWEYYSQKTWNRIRSGRYNNRICDTERLEAFEINIDNITEIYLTDGNEVVYDLSVNGNHNFIVSENNIIVHNSGKSLAQTLRKQTDLNIKEAQNPTKDKEARANDVAPFVEAGRVYLIRGGWNDDFINQVCTFPNAKHDEEVDCLVMACHRAFRKPKLIRT